MSDLDLKNKPLVEAFIEIKWELKEGKTGGQSDPHYKFLLGPLREKISEKYPEYEALPTATIPDEMAGYMVQHRFRASAGGWPIIQVGPGVFSFNQTTEYVWTEFREQAVEAVDKLFEAYPKKEDLKINSIFLKYIDALEVDYFSENIFDYLKNKLKINVDFPDNLFEGSDVQSFPQAFNMQTSFSCSAPPGRINLLFATGHHKKGEDNQPALIWHITMHSAGNDVPEMPNQFSGWLDAAHRKTHDWFFKLVDGDLLRSFRGE